MNQAEWIDLFQSINNRQPSQAELEAAIENGVITEASPKKKQTSSPVFSRPAADEAKGFVPPADQKDQAAFSSQSQSASSQQTTRAAAGTRRPRPAQPTAPEPLMADAPKPETVAKGGSKASNPASQAVRRASFGGVHQAPWQSQETLAQKPQTSSPAGSSATASQASKPAINPLASKTKPKKKAKWPKVLMALLALILLAGAGCGGYAWHRNQSGNIEGTWQLVHWEYRNTGSEAGGWVDALQRYKNQGYAYYDFITVKDQHYQEDSYTYNKKDASKPYLSLWSYLDDIYTVNQWDRKIEIRYSASDYKKKVSQVLKTDLKGYYNYLKSADVDKDIKKTMVSYNYSRRYEVKGDRLVVTIKDDNGQTISKSVYKKLSASKTKALKKQFQSAKQKFEKNYHIK